MQTPFPLISLLPSPSSFFTPFFTTFLSLHPFPSSLSFPPSLPFSPQSLSPSSLLTCLLLSIYINTISHLEMGKLLNQEELRAWSSIHLIQVTDISYWRKKRIPMPSNVVMRKPFCSANTIRVSWKDNQRNSKIGQNFRGMEPKANKIWLRKGKTRNQDF